MAAAAVVVSAPEPAPAQARLAASGWRAPVDGALLRGFHPGAHRFAAGAHRGIDLAAAPGARVGAACSGRVTFAGAVPGAGVVTVACGRWRVTHLPLGEVAVDSGDGVRTGERVGSVAAANGHAGLHLGVRRSGRRFGYVDPWPLLFGAGGAPAVPAPLPSPRLRAGRRAPVPRQPPRPSNGPGARVSGRDPARIPDARVAAPRARDAPAPGPVPLPAGRAPASQAPGTDGGQPFPLAPPLAWAGLALLLAGVARSRSRSRRVERAIRLRAKEPVARPR